MVTEGERDGPSENAGSNESRGGFKQLLVRGMTGFMSFAIGLSAVSPLLSVTSILSYGLATGGPVMMVWTWLITFFMSIIVACNFAEMCSVFPFTGSVYHWAGVLSSKEWAPILSYWTGLFNWVGNTAGDSFFAYAFAVFVSSARETSGSNALSAPLLVSLAISVLFIWTILNFIRVEDIGWIYNMASVLQIGTILALSIVILSTAPHLNSLSFVFFDYNNSTGFTQEYYVVMLSFLYPLFGFVGYDSPAHLAEETKSSRKVSSMGIIYTVLGCGITGFLVLLALLFGLQDITQAIEGPSGNAAVEIIQQTAGRYVASVFSWILVINMFFTGMSSVTVTSRILYVLCRDKASHYAEPLATVHPHYRSPINASIFLFLIQFLLLLIPLFSARGVVAFYSVLSICVVGLQISYLIPVVLKVLIFINPEENSKMLARLQNSYISLGVFSLPLGILASIWLFFTTLLLLLPTNYPITGATMNYTSVVLIITITAGIINWEYNSKHTFTGPPRSFDIDDNESNENNENTNDTHATLVPTRELEPLIRGR